MQIFIANIDSISKNPDTYATLLSAGDKNRLGSFQKQTRKLQFILGHLIADNCGGAYTSIAHRDNWVVVAAADSPVGIDIENTTIQRDFTAAGELMNLPESKSLDDFYKSFTESEATYKLGAEPKCIQFKRHGDYLICATSTQDFVMPQIQDFDINSILPAEKEQRD